MGEQATVMRPIINEEDIDQEARARFLALFNEQHKDQWCCPSCNNYNKLTSDKCESCETMRPSTNHNNTSNTFHAQTPSKENNENESSRECAYYGILNEHHEILEY